MILCISVQRESSVKKVHVLVLEISDILLCLEKDCLDKFVHFIAYVICLFVIMLNFVLSTTCN